MKTVTLNQYLTALADCPPDLASQRHLAQHAAQSVALCLEEGGYPARLRQTFPPLKSGARISRRDLDAWWDAFRAWLRDLTPRELRCLERELIICPDNVAVPGGRVIRLRAWAAATSKA